MKTLGSLLSLSSKPLDMPVEMGHIYSKSDIAKTDRKIKKMKSDLKRYSEVLSKVKDFVIDYPLLSDRERRDYKNAEKYSRRIRGAMQPLEARLRWMKASHELDFPQPDKHLILKYSIERNNIMPDVAAKELDEQLDTVFFPPYITERAKFMLWKYRTFTYAGEPTWEAGDYKHRRKWLFKAAAEEDKQWGIGKTPMQDIGKTNIKNWEKLRDFVIGMKGPYIQDTLSSAVGKGTSRFSAVQLAKAHNAPPVSKDIVTNVPLSDFSGYIAKKNQEDAVANSVRRRKEIEMEEMGFFPALIPALTAVGAFVTTTLPAFIVSFLSAPMAFLIANVPALGPVLSLVPEGLMPLLTMLGEAEAKKVVNKITPEGVRKAVNVLAPETARPTPSIQSALPVNIPSLPAVPEVVKTVVSAPVTVVKAVASGTGTVVKAVTSGVSISSPSLPTISGGSISAPTISKPTISSSTLSESRLGRKILSKANEAISKEYDALEAKKDALVTKVTEFDAQKMLEEKAKEELMKALMPKPDQSAMIQNGHLVAAPKQEVDHYAKLAEQNKPKEKGLTNALLIGAAAVAGVAVLS